MRLPTIPSFARRQGGFWLGGPIKKDKLFLFSNLENINQNGVYITVPYLPSFPSFGSLSPAPYGRQESAKIDYHLSAMLFLSYSYDGYHNSGLFGIPVQPSNFVSNRNASPAF